MSTETWLAISAGAMFLLALAAFWAIWQNYSFRKREHRHRLLNEIIEWVTDIQKVSLEVDIPVTGASLTKEQRRRIEVNTLLRYGIPFIRNDYIKTIVSEAFKEELQRDAENMIKAFTAFMFCRGKSFGIKDIKSSFRGTTLKTIEEVEERLKEKALHELLDEYTNEKSKYANILLIKVGNIMASL